MSDYRGSGNEGSEAHYGYIMNEGEVRTFWTITTSIQSWGSFLYSSQVALLYQSIIFTAAFERKIMIG